MLEQRDLQMITEAMEAVLLPIHARLDGLETRLENLETRLEGLEIRLENLETRLDELEKSVEEVKIRLSNVEMTLENETNRNILFIADGHIDLNRKLNEAIKLGQDALAHVERFEIRQIHFDNELSIIKERLGRLEQERGLTYDKTA